MADFVTLSCPNCGGKLEITQDIEKFACSYCGQEQIVKRGRGIISLKPVVDELKEVKVGVDKTASELAINRIVKEINEINEEIEKLNRGNESGCLWVFIIPAFIMVLIAISEKTIIPLFIGGFFIYGIFFLMHHNDKKLREELTPFIEKKKELESALSKHKKIVSSE